MSAASFQSFPLAPELLNVLTELGYEQPTPIQAQTLGPLLEGKDVVGQSQTGSGKTAAFTLPILQSLDLKSGLQAVILCPTRELGTQVVREIRKLGRGLSGLQVALLVGGQPSKPQLEALESGAHIAVATPGRLADFINRDKVDFSKLKILVMDEADKMLEMGFAEEIEFILDEIPKTRQTMFFSATFPQAVLQLSSQFTVNAIKVEVGEDEGSMPDIEQFAYEVEGDKVGTLMRVLQQHIADSTIVFCNQKATIQTIVDQLGENGIPTASLHGDLEQRDRDRMLALFRNGSARLLIATDVAARGLDIDDLGLVVNYDLPQQSEVYVHRIGRTGRAGKTGSAVSLYMTRESLRIHELEKFTKKTFIKKPLGFKNQHGLGKAHRDTSMQTLVISGGRKDKLRAGDLLGALTGDGGLNASEVGKIEIHDQIIYVAVASGVVDEALQRLREGRIKGRKFQVKLVKI